MLDIFQSCNFCTLNLFHFPLLVADAWRALKNPSIGESSMEGLTSVLSTSGSPTDGLSVLQGNYSETASFAALSGGTLTGGTLTGGMLSGGRAKYCRYCLYLTYN